MMTMAHTDDPRRTPRADDSAGADADVHPERMCVGCRQKAAQEELVRFAIVDQPPFVAPEPARRLGGRGASVHPTRACVVRAVSRGGFARAARKPVQLDAGSVLSMLSAYYEKRAESLILAAHRRRLLAFGTDAVREAMRAGGISLLVVAHDAAGRRREIETAATRLGTRCAVFSNKARFGALLGKPEVGVIALLDDGISAEVWRAASRIRALREDDE